MLPKSKRDSFSLVDEGSDQLKGETQSVSSNKPSAIIGFIFFVVIITWTLFKIENISSKPKLLAWCSQRNNKISIVELETQQEFANFVEVALKDTNGIFHSFILDSTSLTIH